MDTESVTIVKEMSSTTIAPPLTACFGQLLFSLWSLKDFSTDDPAIYENNPPASKISNSNDFNILLESNKFTPRDRY